MSETPSRSDRGNPERCPARRDHPTPRPESDEDSGSRVPTPDRAGPDAAGADRFEHVAAGYDRWIGWGPRLARELPFLLASLPRPAAAGARILDIGCGTGAHAIALASAGYPVTGLDQSPAMLEEARRAENRARAEGRLPPEATLRWEQGDITEPAILRGSTFQGVTVIGNSLLALGEEDAVLRGLQRMIQLVAPGGVLILQYLNGTRIRRQGRLAVKAAEAGSGATDPGGTAQTVGGAPQIWLRHHFEAGNNLYFHSYVLHQQEGVWKAEVRRERLVDLPPETIRELLAPHFERVQILAGLSEREFSAEESDAVGVRAAGRRASVLPAPGL